MLSTIPVDMIDNGQRLRDISEAQVASLTNSIAEIGLLNPITVYVKKVLRGGTWVDGYGLIAGLHRKTAFERLGVVEIEANILDLADLDRQIAECDENLCAPQLSPSDRARFTKRRKDAYEAKYPETRNGGDRRSTRSQTLRSENEAERFTANTAAATGQSERAVQLYAERGEKISDVALDLIKGTRFDTGAYLDRLKKLTPEEQIAAVKEDIAVLKRPAQLPSLQSIQRVKLDTDIRMRAAKACAELIAEHLPPDAWDHFKSNLAVTTSKDLLTEFTNITGQSVMDRGAA